SAESDFLGSALAFALAAIFSAAFFSTSVSSVDFCSLAFFLASNSSALASSGNKIIFEPSANCTYAFLTAGLN
ncbi:hypothetical protein CP02DC21_1463, partial [Chlamydia psittaci 02DC21]